MLILYRGYIAYEVTTHVAAGDECVSERDRRTKTKCAKTRCPLWTYRLAGGGHGRAGPRTASRPAPPSRPKPPTKQIDRYPGDRHAPRGPSADRATPAINRGEAGARTPDDLARSQGRAGVSPRLGRRPSRRAPSAGRRRGDRSPGRARVA